MTLNDRWHSLMAAHPELPPEECLWRAVNAHKAAQAVLATSRHHPDAFRLIDAHLDAHENHKRLEPQLSLLLESLPSTTTSAI